MGFLNISTGKKMRVDDMVILTTSLSFMSSAGLTMRDCVSILHDDPNSKLNKNGLKVLIDGFDSGLVLSEIFRENENVFGEGLWKQVEAAERTGKVPEALLRIADQFKNGKTIASKIKGALAYPAFLIFVALIAGYYLLTNTIPEMGEMIEELGGSMPAITMFMMWLCNILISHGVLIAIGLVGIVVGIYMLLTRVIKVKWHKFISSAPLSGSISVNVNYARIYTLLDDMIENGAHVVEALRVAASAADNLFISKEVLECADVMESEGLSLSESLSLASSMPSDDKLMLAVGSRTGREIDILKDLAERRNSAAQDSVARLLELMTPIIMVFVCGMVGVLVVAIYMPMLTMASSIG